MDLEPLKIDRGQARSSKRRRGGSSLTRFVPLLVIAVLLWLFRAPLLQFYEGFTLPRVQTVRVVRQSPASASAVRGAAANGYIVARTRAALSADTPGRIIEMLVEEGSVVAKDELVARLYDAEYRAALARAEAELQLAKAELKRAQSERNASAAELERLRAQENVSAANLKEAQALARLAASNLKRYATLVEEGVERQQMLDERRQDHESKSARVVSVEAELGAARAAATQGESRLETAEAQIGEALARIEVRTSARDLARATLEKTEVRAPFAGIVVLKDAEVGEVVSPNSQGGSSRGSVVTMVDFDSLEVQADVPETSLSAVQLNAPAKVFLDAFPDHPYEGIVERIWPTADRQKATVEVRIGFESPDDRLRPEMGVRVVFMEESAAAADSSEEEQAEQELSLLQIPAECVVRMDGIDRVFVLERDVVRLRSVQVSPGRAGRMNVDSGVEAGETLVLSPPSNLKDGARVRTESGS